MTKTRLPAKLQNAIVEALKPVAPQAILLFGSYAYGEPRSESDIDLLVVVDKDEIPRDYTEKAEIYLSVSRAIRAIERQVPIDLLVYTKPEFERFMAQGSQISQKIKREGVRLL